MFDASHHMVNNLKWFTNIKLQNGELCRAGENSKLYYVGTVKFRVKGDANRNITVILTDVLYVSELRENLLSYVHVERPKNRTRK